MPRTKRRSKRTAEEPRRPDYRVGSVIKREGQPDEKAVIIWDDHIPCTPGTSFAFINQIGKQLKRRLTPGELWVFGYDIIRNMTGHEVLALRGAYRARNLPTVPKPESRENTSDNTPRHTYEGASRTSLLRWMGFNGWSNEEAILVFAKLDIPISPLTVGVQIKGGLLGRYGKPASLNEKQSERLESLRGGKLRTCCFTGTKKPKRGRSRRTK